MYYYCVLSPLLRAKAELQPYWKKSWFSFLITVLVIGIAALVVIYFVFPSESPSETAGVVGSAITVLTAKTVGLVTAYVEETELRPPKSRVSSVATTNGDYFAKCAPAVTCDPSAKYRTYNGSCNNLQKPNWGAAMTPFYRLIDAEFDDGKS